MTFFSPCEKPKVDRFEKALIEAKTAADRFNLFFP